MPLFKKPIEQEFINLRLRAGRLIPELKFYASELTAWETSPERREMIDGDRYYTGDHNILRRQRTAIGPDGELIMVKRLIFRMKRSQASSLLQALWQEDNHSRYEMPHTVAVGQGYRIFLAGNLPMLAPGLAVSSD